MRKSAIALALALTAGLSAHAEIIEQVLVKVNGDILTKSELESRQVAALRQRLRQNVNEADLRRDDELKKALIEVTPQLLVDAVDEMLVLQRGRELGYKMGDDQFNNILQNIRKENKLEDDAQFEAALKQEGLTLADLRKSLERQMIFSRVQQVEVFQRIAITEDEARRYYDAHPTEFTSPSQVTLREILVEVPTPANAQPGSFSVAADDEAKAKAEALRKRAQSGEDFAQLAASESASASKANGGLIGPIGKDELAPALQDLLAKMKPGGISEIIRTARGYQFLKLETMTETQTLSFEEARDQIANKVFTTKRAGEMEKYLTRLRQQAIIEWKNEELKKLYDQRVAVGRAPAATPANPPSL